jgi:uridine phosphorylase
MHSPKHLARHREYNLYVAKIAGQSVVVCSTGIGGPSTSIAVEELAQLGITTFLRVGTTGAIQPHIAVGDVIITTASVRLDGASLHFAPIEFPAVANYELMKVLEQSSDELGLQSHTGVTASSDTFYPGQERYDTFTGRVPRRFKGSVKEWQEMGVLNFEMESATLFTMCASSGLKAACVSGVIVNRALSEIPDNEVVKSTELNSIRVVIEATNRLLSMCR